MGAIASLVSGSTHTVEHAVVGERSEQFVVALARLMDAGQDRIYHVEQRSTSDASGCSAFSRGQSPVGVGGRLERPDDARPNRDDAA